MSQVSKLKGHFKYFTPSGYGVGTLDLLDLSSPVKIEGMEVPVRHQLVSMWHPCRRMLKTRKQEAEQQWQQDEGRFIHANADVRKKEEINLQYFSVSSKQCHRR